MSVKTMMQESIIETVVNHQFESAYVALENCNSLEFSGFGKMFFNKPKAVKKLERMRKQKEELSIILKDTSLTEIRTKNAQLKLEIVTKNFEILNKKLNGTIENLGGVEKSIISPEGIEGIDSEGERTKALNM